MPTAIAEITDIPIEEADEGIVLRLASEGELSVSETTIEGNTAIAEIPNADLRLAHVEGIASVSVSRLGNNRVRIAIAGTDALPRDNRP